MSQILKFPSAPSEESFEPSHSSPQAEALAALQSRRDDMVYVANFMEGLQARLSRLLTDEKPVAALASKAGGE